MMASQHRQQLYQHQQQFQQQFPQQFVQQDQVGQQYQYQQYQQYRQPQPQPQQQDPQRFAATVEHAFATARKRILQRAWLITLVILLVLGAVGVKRPKAWHPPKGLVLGFDVKQFAGDPAAVDFITATDQ